ncbi:urease accessory protein UreF [Amycolatopsis magusensis]|uniref:urease accessory protein UreF n=1 Tax=Amycolatopsis magusensis TaxID=882444 RepID=UPI0037B465DD
MNIAALIMADSRFPGGGHVHSGGLEETVVRKLVRAERDLPSFLSGRLRTAGLLAASFAAAACRQSDWALLDAELDARTPSAAQRESSRAQGRGTVRAGKVAWPSPVLDELLRVTPRPHHPIAVGALTGVAGGAPIDAALAVAYLAVSGPASAAVRLLGLDPFVVNAVVARLAGELHAVAEDAAAVAGEHPADLPAPGAPALDLLAEAHARGHKEEVRLFAS